MIKPLLQKMIDILSQHNWREYPNEKPAISGWVQCIVIFDCRDDKILYYVMDLWYNNETDKFIDNRRKNVYDLYDVMGYQHGNEKAKIYYDNLCDRTADVVAWQPLASVFRLPKRKANIKD